MGQGWKRSGRLRTAQEVGVSGMCKAGGPGRWQRGRAGLRGENGASPATRWLSERLALVNTDLWGAQQGQDRHPAFAGLTLQQGMWKHPRSYRAPADKRDHVWKAGSLTCRAGLREAPQDGVGGAERGAGWGESSGACRPCGERGGGCGVPSSRRGAEGRPGWPGPGGQSGTRLERATGPQRSVPYTSPDFIQKDF